MELMRWQRRKRDEQTASVYLAVPVWESAKANSVSPDRVLSPRLNCLATEMPVRYISGDVRQSTVSYIV